MLVGGSGLYVRAARRRPRISRHRSASCAPQLEEELRELGPAALHARLAQVDPAAAAAILPGNGRRIVRALEVVALTGSFSAQLPAHNAIYDVVFIGLDRPDLDERVANAPTDVGAGFVDEVRALQPDGLRDGRTASRALGYAQVLAWMDGQLCREAGGPERDGAGHAPVRSSPAVLVPPRSTHSVAERLLLGEHFRSPPMSEIAQVDAAESLIAGARHR